MTYTCAQCGGTFESTWSEEEAHAEQLAVFGVAHREGDPVVCDECYQRMVKRYPPADYREPFRVHPERPEDKDRALVLQRVLNSLFDATPR